MRKNEAYRIQRLKEAVHRHDKVGTQVYHAWSNMIQRCTNENVPHYEDYGAKGVSVCDAWLDDFMNFYSDMGDPPSTAHSLDRIDCFGNYNKQNCRWADWETQCNNKGNTVYLTLDELTLPIRLWATKLNVPYTTLYRRWQRGWDVQRILTQTRKGYAYAVQK